MGMVGEACLPSNAYYPRTPDYTLCSGVHVCWSEHSHSSFVYGFMSGLRLWYHDRNYLYQRNEDQYKPAHLCCPVRILKLFVVCTSIISIWHNAREEEQMSDHHREWRFTFWFWHSLFTYGTRHVFFVCSNSKWMIKFTCKSHQSAY